MDLRVILIAGVPGSGKSSLMKAVLPPGGEELRFRTLRGKSYNEGKLFVAGVYEDGDAYPGTDRLSMAVQPDFIQFVERAKAAGTPQTILAEGDRLSNKSLLKALRDLNVDTYVLVLKLDPTVLEERRRRRGDTFDETWLKGRITKVENFKVEAESLGILEERFSENQRHLIGNAELLSNLIFGR